MQRFKKGLCGLVSLALVVTMFAGCGKKEEPASTSTVSEVSSTSAPVDSAKAKEKTEVRVLDCWNGSSQDAANDMQNNAVAKKIFEETNVVFNFEYATTNETEKLNMLFAAGDLPYDLVFAPYWGGEGNETGAIKKAAVDGLVKPLEDMIEKYGENIKPALSTNLKASFIKEDLNPEKFNGHTYVVPYETHATLADYRNEGMGLWARKDIMEKLGWKQEDFSSSDKVAEYLKAVKVKVDAGEIKDAVGKPVIPAGTWSNGWEAQQFAKSWKDNSTAGFYVWEGTTYCFHRGPLFEKQILFVRQLVADGLFDKEAFSQNDTIAKEKMAVGKYAMVPAHYYHMRDNLGNTLYKEHPEMTYVPVGPIPNAYGEIGEKRVTDKGGSPVWFIPNSTSDDVAKATIYAINWLNSKEGKVLPFYGVEGTNFDYADNKPVMKDEFVAKAQAGTLAKDTGIQGSYRKFVSLRPFMSEWGEFTPGDAKSAGDIYKYAVEKMNPFIQIPAGKDAFSACREDFAAADKETFDKVKAVWWDKLWGELDTTLKQRAYLAKTEADAKKIIADVNDQMVKAGIEKMEKFLTDHQKDLNIIF